MSNFDKDEYDRRLAIKRERLAPLFARLPEGTPPGMIWIGPGWHDLVLDLDAKLAEIDPGYTVAQVKEKFGGLRFYARASENYAFEGTYIESPFYKAISVAEGRSYETCEDCGARGKGAPGSWSIVLCPACLAARGEDRTVK